MMGFRVCATLATLILAFAALADSSGLPYFTGQSMAPTWTDGTGHGSMRRMGAYSLENQLGESLSSQDARGRVRVVNFFFATCPGICPTTMFNLKRAQDAAMDDTLLISFSITPGIDTAVKLAEYGESMGIDSDRWQLLTGDAAQVEMLAEEVFLAVLDRTPGTSAMAHTEKAFLLDREGFIRGVYNATSAADVMRLVEDLELLQLN
jgi:protein SCO1/2